MFVPTQDTTEGKGGYIHMLGEIRTSDSSVQVVQDREATVIGFDFLIMISLKYNAKVVWMLHLFRKFLSEDYFRNMI
jgi:hypothetical protein